MDTLMRGEDIPYTIGGSGYASAFSAQAKWIGAVAAATALQFSSSVVFGTEAGSGGTITDNTIKSKSNWVYDKSYSFPEVDVEEITIVNTADEELVSIKKYLGLTTTDIAKLIGVTRPTVYSWLKGKDPKPEHIAKINLLKEQADKVSSIELTGMNKLVRRPLKAGGSLIDLISRGEDIDAALEELKVLSQRESENRRKRKGLGYRISSFEEVMDSDFS